MTANRLWLYLLLGTFLLSFFFLPIDGNGQRQKDSSSQSTGDTIIVSKQEDSVLVTLPANHPQKSDTVELDHEQMEHRGLTSDTPVFRAVPGKIVGSWKKEKDFAYANNPAYWVKELPDMRPNRFMIWLIRLLQSKGFHYFILCLLAGVLLYALIRVVVQSDLRSFFQAPKRSTVDAQNVASPLEEDLEEQLQLALAAKDYRQAIRWLYLRSLKLLNDRQLIRYHMQLTNRDYVRQLTGHPFGEPFRFLTNIYDKVWYGDFAVSVEQFDQVQSYFQNFYKSIGPS